MRKMSASDYTHYVPEGAGEVRSTLVELVGFRDHLTAEFRCTESIQVNAIDRDGQTVFLGEGKIVSIDGIFDGFAAFEVLAKAAYCYWLRGKGRWLEVPDPTPVAVTIDQPANKPVADLVRAELQKYLARRNMDAELATDVSVEELLDDIEQGDLEFEAEPDMFGLGYEERMQEFLAEAPKPAEPSTPAPAAPAAGAPAEAPVGDGSPPAAKPAS